MKLNGFDRQVAMPNAHDHAVFRFGRHFQTAGNLLRIAYSE